MKCVNCNGKKLIKVSVEGVSFSMLSELEKTFSRGVYGFNSYVCVACGRINKTWKLTESALLNLNILSKKNNVENKKYVKGTIVNCSNCGCDEFVEGTLEGVYFKPSKENKKGFLAKPLHHPHTIICLKCGIIAEIILNVAELKKAIKE